MGIRDMVFSGDKDTKNIQVNNLLILLFRGAGILCNFYIIPVTLRYLDDQNYGVWLTLTSIISWLAFMDVGLGNGMRNKIAGLVENGSRQVLREYISTTYGLFSAIILVVFILFSCINPFLPWSRILRTSLAPNALLALSYIVVFSFSLRLILDLATMIFVALHKPFIKTFIEFLFNAFTLLLVFALTYIDSRSLVLYGAAVSFVPVIILVIFSIVLFRKNSKYHYLRPSLNSFKKTLAPELFGLGIQFFVIQIAALIVFSTDNLLITQLFSADEVTVFNIAYKYFSIITLAFTIILMPYWSSFTTAYYGGRLDWIKKAFRKLILLWIAQVAGIVILIIAAPFAYKMWIGKDLKIPFNLNLWMGIYVMIYNWNNLFVYFLNGISKIRLQLYSSILIGLFNIPLAYALAKFTKIGLPAIMVANCACLLLCSVWAPIQCYKILRQSAGGVWNK